MTPFEVALGIIAFVIVAAIGAWALILRQYKKQEMAQQQRMYAGIGLSLALALFFAAMPAAIWVKGIGIVLAAVMLVSSVRQSNPKVLERQAALRREKDKEKQKSRARRTSADDYMPYYKMKQQKQKRSK